MFQNPGKKNEFYFWYCIGNSLRRKKKKCWKIIYIYDHIFVGSSWKFLFIASKNCDLPFTHFVNKDKTKQKLSFKF